jgi:Ni/Fe-hydrogenase subunit HybB-like protein
MRRSFSLVKSALWAVMGAWAVVTIVRYWHGLGATTNLNDATPWGLWIAFDVMAGVALAAGGFVLAATVYVFGLERYRPFVRPAVLTAFLGYVAVAVGLLYDLGLPWHIWHPVLFPQYHSVLFEVAMCVMLYLTVLALEFSPTVLEHPWLDRPVLRAVHKAIKRLTIPLVIAGIVLSTLHQSSLGSLFLIQPFRVHPLWYSPIIYALFFISAVALGLMMVTLESLLSGWYFDHEIRRAPLGGLGRVASVVLFLYVAVRLGDLLVRDKLGYAFDGSWQSGLFLFELLVSALLPAVLLSFRRVRTSLAGLSVCAALVVLGMIGYRFDICIVTFTRPNGLPYVPSWMEVVVSAGVVAGAILTFVWFVERFRVCAPEEHAEPFIPPSNDLAGIPEASPVALASARRHSLIFVVAAALTVGALPARALFGARPSATPVVPPGTVSGWEVRPAGAARRHYVVPALGMKDVAPAAAERTAVKLMLINGNRDERWVLFDHALHVAQLGGDTACTQCHHQNLPFDQNTSCSVCHRDMYETTDTFDHAFHVSRMGGNAGCVQCHADDAGRKSRDTAQSCQECHADMIAAGARIPAPPQGLTGFAAGYLDAMHGLCINCHKEVAERQNRPNHARCDTCHRPEIEAVDLAKLLLRTTPPRSPDARPQRGDPRDLTE